MRRLLSPVIALTWLAIAAPIDVHAAPANCQTLLVGRSYSCRIHIEGGSTIMPVPLSFSAAQPAPGTISLKFDADLFGTRYGCTCAASGTVDKTKFNGSRAFSCIFTGGDGPLNFSGTVTQNASKITGLFFNGIRGSSSLGTCVATS
jgi:hypothetical protein